MTTVEKLLVQIFEQKNSIIEQVKQQTELYSQHLASKLLIDGITPPSWLLGPTTSSNSKELKKEELISKLLRPCPQPSVRCSFANYPVCNNLVATGYNEDFSERIFTESLAFDKGHHRQDDTTVPVFSREDHAGCAVDSVPEPDASVKSPGDQRDERILNIYSVPEQSRTVTQRSKSRQKALELRNSAKALAKNGLNNENISNASSDHIRFSLSGTNHGGQKDVLAKLAEPCVVDNQSFKVLSTDESYLITKEKEKNLYSGRVTRSRSHAKVPVFVGDSSTLGCSSVDCKDNASCHVAKERRGSMPITDHGHGNNHVSQLPKSAQPSAVCHQSCGNGTVNNADCLNKDKETNFCTGRVTRSKISRKSQSCALVSSKAGGYRRTDTVMMDSGDDDLPPDYVDGSLVKDSSYNVLCEGCEARESISEESERHRERCTIPSWSSSQHNVCAEEVSDLEIPSQPAKADGGILAPSSVRSFQLVDNSNELRGLVKPSTGFFRRVTRSQTHSKEQGTYEPVDYSENPKLGGAVSKSVCKQKFASDELQSTSGERFIPPTCETHNMLEEHEIASSVIPSELVSLDHVDQSGSYKSSDAKHRRQLESQVVPTSWGSSAFVEPKQLNFNEIEEGNRKALTSTSGKGPANSAENRIYSLSDRAVSVDKGISEVFNQIPSGKLSQGMSDVSFNRGEATSKGEEARWDSFESVAVTSSSGKRGVANAAEKISCSLSDPALSVDKGVSCGVNQLSLGKQLQGIFDVSNKGEEARRDSSGYDAQDNPFTLAEKHEHVISDCTMEKLSKDFEESELNYKISEARQKADIVLSKMVDIPEVQIHPLKLNVEHGLESSKKRQEEEGNWSGEGIDEGQMMSNAPESKHLAPPRLHDSSNRADSCDSSTGKVQMTNSICVLDKIKRFSAQESLICSCLEVSGPQGYSTVRSPHGENSSLERRFRHAGLESWPQPKRRKIERRQTHNFTTTPVFRARTPRSKRGSPRNFLKNTEIDVDTVLMDSFDVNKSTDVEIHPITGFNLTEGIESPSYASQKAELTQVEFCYNKENVEDNASVIIDTKQLGTALVSSLTKKEARNSQGCFVEGMITLHSSSNDAREPGDEQCRQHLHGQEKDSDDRSENSILTSTMLEGIQSLKRVGGSKTQHSVLSPSIDDLDLVGVDQSMPVFEGFTVDAEAESGELDIAANGINLDIMDLPRNTVERASILAEICRSASLDTPLSHFSSTFEFKGTQKLFQSVSKGHLAHLDVQSTLSSNSDVEEQLQSGFNLAFDSENALEGMPHSDCLAYSGARYDLDSKNHETPVRKLWERLSSHNGSSEKLSSSNPELVCFPIEEDPRTSEENKSADEYADDDQEEVDSSLANHSDKRQPFKDLTNFNLNHHMSVSTKDEALRADGVDIVNTKLRVSGAQDTAQLIPKNQYRDESQTREKQTSYLGSTNGWKKQTLSIDTNANRKTKESVNNSMSKPGLSNKASLKRQDQKHSLKESKRNNIVSNVSSFIPLIQQKQVSSVCAGKRDVKVKALEAAEAAKRLEEKRENERKMRKEALKLERAKLEEKNLRHMELQKKKKEEERKKKDADDIAKKRLREEEARKEREKKRMRLETRQRQRQEEKMRAEKAEKDKQQSKYEQMNSKKDFHIESNKQLNKETSKGDDKTLEKTETISIPTKDVMNYEECGTYGLSCEAEKAMPTVDKSPKNEDLIVQNSQGKSYEISPYQCSDDEDEEDDELPTKKYIPSWASKSSVALHLPLQQDMDPDAIFPPESFCSVDEVLLPRKLQQKENAAGIEPLAVAAVKS